MNGRYAPYHILDKAIVPGDINQGGALVEEGKTNIDGHTATLLFGLGIGIYAGKAMNQRSFTVVYVSGKTNYYLVDVSTS